MSFADLPGTVLRLLTGAPGGVPDVALPTTRADRVGVVLLDAFGRRFVERHAGHPFLRRLHITPLRSQFPSTTAAHVTTMHTGRPVGEHGLYEWRVYEPAIDQVILPLPFAQPGGEPDSLCAAGLDPGALLAPGTFYEQLAGIDCVAIQPDSFCPSTFDGVATRGARLVPYHGIAAGAEALVDELSRPGRRYAFLYWDAIDVAGHHRGPDSAQFDAACVEALGALERAISRLRDAVVLVTADHGQVSVSPDRVDYLDELWPELPGHLTHAPAGSSRDCFLHTAEPEHVAHELAERLGERADVHLVEDLVTAGWFGMPGPRLRARLADVCVLPAPGRQAWLRRHASVEQHFLGMHGGTHPDERDTWLGVYS